jgi:hypothetical protein
MQFGGIDGPGALVQQANFTVNRTVNMIYEIGSNNVYYVGNRSQGQAQLSRVVGSSAKFAELLNKFGNMCEPDVLTLTAKGGCGEQGGGAGTTYKLLESTLTSIGGSVSAQEIIITEQLGFICSDIDVGA